MLDIYQLRLLFKHWFRWMSQEVDVMSNDVLKDQIKNTSFWNMISVLSYLLKLYPAKLLFPSETYF